MTTVLDARAHGGPDALGVPPYDFSTNANACGPCPQALAAVQAAEVTHYPDSTYTALRERLAAFHAVDPERIVPAGSGSEFIFRFTAWASRHGVRSVALPPHGYGDYGHAARAWGLQAVHDGAAGLLWLCDPGSPLGQPETRVLVATHTVLDRAYEPLRLEGTHALDGRELEEAWQLWSPNKALGLTGVRGAYAIAPAGAHAAAAELAALAPSWPLGTHAVAMLEAWCEPQVQRWLQGSLETLRRWKAEQLALCGSFGWTSLPSVANYFVCRGPTPTQLRSLHVQGIKLRDCASFGLPGHVRLSVQPPAAQDALRHAWERLG
jgi:histidinol-phosphate aminotransferase